MLDEELFPTAMVVTEKLADVAFSAMVTVEGTETIAGLLLVTATIAPPLGAGPPKVTVAVDELPPVTLAGLKFREAKFEVTRIETVAVFETCPRTSV